MKMKKIADGEAQREKQMLQEDYLWELRYSLEGIALMAMDLSKPETIEQAKDNLKGIGRYVKSALAKHDISTEWK